ncbi:MAG TPA: GNAT family N-acetyltransferase, partial [Pseudonocardiaceae bacterium]|nr:GNAT family N-acetyltransferase [Pseudonocardiaceae bacterium]
DFGETPEQATAHARREWEIYFPDGRPAAGHRHYHVVDGERRVGTLWLGPMPDRRPDREWVYYVEVDESLRGKGYGRGAMELAERDALAHGATELGLNVFGSNTVARGLYEAMGYRATAITMAKPLGQPAE